MQRDSYLALDALYLQSQNALEVIELENEKYETLMGDFQSNVVNYTGTGEVATSLKNYVMRIRRLVAWMGLLMILMRQSSGKHQT